MQRVDIVIAGGGLVGASLALCLQKMAKHKGWAIHLVEPYAPTSDFQPSYDTRNSAISYGSRLIYERLGVWEAISEHAQPITDIHVVERGHYAFVNLTAKQEKVPALGYVINNAWLGQCLLEALDKEVIHCHYGTAVKQLTPCIEGYQVELEDGDQLNASLVVVADGGRSSLRDQLGIYVKRTAYGQSAIIANVTPSYAHNGRAFECFAKHSPLALLPLDDQRCALVWTKNHEEAKRLLSVSDEAFLSELQVAFGDKLGELKQVGKRHSYPLELSIAEEQVRPHLVLLGSAAHGLHPVAGQGYNLSLRDTWCLAQTLIGSDKPLGDLLTLQQYVQQRLADQRRIIGFSDCLVHLFTHRNLALGLGRRLGLVGLNLLTPAKRWFALQAMGLGIDQ